ncbi:hypothetical protein CLV49_0605 [Labedella gwakjiensis]|uniref:Uncharacterized protein n=1 Tax=Labedella gwakjiensis TaxID=390269 RepID=A0A2P8GSS0_9MICO|nr:hypothetical protein [Labedella gwakjiensis]PSL37002.1 hypothetical protein CLV49_0605 [Labedella gwakjiensis]RUQ81839.1 hypothetical protein ELQ93_17580 [Labedella gwakjiensis]
MAPPKTDPRIGLTVSFLLVATPPMAATVVAEPMRLVARGYSSDDLLTESISASSAAPRLAINVQSAGIGTSAGIGLPQDYYWTEDWQSEEARALHELETGEFEEFDSADAVLDWLHEDE